MNIAGNCSSKGHEGRYVTKTALISEILKLPIRIYAYDSNTYTKGAKNKPSGERCATETLARESGDQGSTDSESSEPCVEFVHDHGPVP